ncbi:uncharacterized protein LOC143920292 [Arctopsyche grandis]|uniref:uncharacterized protein LOC143920292 n=1 Tax=Arctopsyche grandis TaxID=121162 RepID=UPI00406D68BD
MQHFYDILPNFTSEMDNINISHCDSSNYLSNASNIALTDSPRILQHKRYNSQRQKSNKATFSTNTFPYKLKRSNINNNSIRQQADIIRYIPAQNTTLNIPDVQSSYIENVFAPDIHSTPIYNFQGSKKTFSKIKKRDSIENSPIQNVYLPRHNSNLQSNEFELYKLNSFSNVPTISKKVETESDQTLHTSSTLCTEGKIIKRRGIRGVSWIFRLALKDNSIGKIYKAQIGWTLLILVIFIVVGALLGCFSKYFFPYHLITFTNYSNVSPKYELIDNNISNDNFLNNFNESTTTTEQDISTTVYHKLSTRLTTLSSTIFISSNQTGTNKQNEYKTDNGSTKSNKISLKSNRIGISNNQFTNPCRECRKSLDVCIASAESGIPTCQPAIDVGDPTGCGGLCALEIEACHLLDHKHHIYTCTPLETYKKCTTDEWKCVNHLCIPKNKYCDGEFNCYDRSDEIECNSCDLAQNFHCGNKTSCLDNSKQCNGVLDCWDASDEFNCTAACPESQFTCNSGECISGSLFCDGLPDCADKSDEPVGCEGKCKKHEFKCTNTRCIPKLRVCNGTDNCGDMSDELDCPHVKTSS